MKKSKRVLALVLAALMVITTPLTSVMDVRAAEVSGEFMTLVDEVVDEEAAPAEQTDTAEVPEADASETEASETAATADEEAVPAETNESDATAEEAVQEAEAEGELQIASLEEIVPTAAAAAETKVVMSLNVLTTGTQPITKAPTAEEDIYNHSNADRGTRFQNMLDSYLPDSIGLCEVTETWKSYLDGTVTKRQYAGGAEYAVAGYKSDLGYDLKSGSSEYSPVLYRSDLYSVAANEQGGYWFSSTPDVKSKYSIDGHVAGNGAVSMHFERVYSYAVLRDLTTGEIAYIHVNAHYDHNSDNYINKLCSVQIANTVKDLRAKYGDVPFVITGDHNRAEQTDAYAYLANGLNGFRDAKYVTDNRSTTASSAGYGTDYTPETSWQIIDHVFVSDEWSVAKHDILVDPYMSDHSAVYTKLVLGERPEIASITVNGASYSSEIDNANNVYFEIASSQATINATASYQLVLETVNADGGVVTSKEFNGSATVDLADGENVFQLVAVGTEARNAVKVTIVKTTSEAYPFVSEIYPNGKVTYAEITNAGGIGVDLGKYVLSLGDVETLGVVDQAKAVNTQLPERWLKPGESVVVVYNGGELALDDVFTTDLNADHMILAAESFTNASVNGGATLYTGGVSVNTSSYAGIATSSVTADQAFVFAVNNGKILRAEYPETLRYATPGVYETEIGAEIRSAYADIQAATAQVLGGEVKKVSEEKTGDYRLDNTKTGSYVCYANIDFGETSPKSVVVNAAAKKSNAGGTIDVYINANAEGNTALATKIASITITGTASDWSVYKQFAGQLTTPVTGVQNVMLVFTPASGKTYVGNVTTLKFTAEVTETEPDESEIVVRKAFEKIQCEWAEDMTAGYKKNGSLATPNLQSTGNATSDKTDGYNILGTTTRGATATFKNVDFGNTSPEGLVVNLAIKNSNCDGVIRIYLYDKGEDGKRVQGDEIAQCVINHNDGPTNDYSKYQDIAGTITKAVTGRHDLLMYFDVTEGYDYVGNMDFFYFTVKTIDAFDIIEAEDVLDEDMVGSKITRESKVVDGISDHMITIGDKQYNKIAGLTSDSQLTYRKLNFGNGDISSVVFNVAMNSAKCGGVFDLYIDSVDAANKIGTVAINNKIAIGSGYAPYQIVEAKLDKDVTGVHDLILKTTLDSGKTWVCHLDYFYFKHSENHDALQKIEAEWGEDITAGTSVTPTIALNTVASQTGYSTYSYSTNGKSYNAVGGTGDQGTVTYKNIDFGDMGVSSAFINIAIKTSNCGGTTEMFIKNADGTEKKIGYFTLPSTKGVSNDYNTYQLFEGVITDTNVTGVHDVVLKFNTDAGMKYVGNIDYFYFTAVKEKDAFNRIQFENTESALTDKTNPNLYNQTKSGLKGMDASSTNGYNSIFNTRVGSSVVFKNIAFGDVNLGSLIINMSGKTTTCGGVVAVYTYDNGEEGTLIAKGKVTIKENGYELFNEMEVPVVENINGTHDIIFKFEELTNANGYFGNLDYFYFTEKGIDAFSRIETEWVSSMSGDVNLQYSTAPANMSSNVTNGKNLMGNTKNGSTAVYRNIDFGTTGEASQFTVNIAMKTGNCAGTIDVYTYDNGVKGDHIASMTLNKDKATDGGAKNYNTYKEYSVNTLKSDITGRHDIILEFSVPSLTYVGNIDYFYFSTLDTKLAVVINGQKFTTDTTIEGYVGDEFDFAVECDSEDGAEVVITDSAVADYIWPDKIVINGSGSSFIIVDCYSDYTGEQLELVITVNVKKDFNDYTKNLPYMHTAPASVNEGEDFKVTLKFNSITESTGVEMFYNKRADGSSFNKVTMTKVGENLYEATIPGSEIKGTTAIQYYFAEVGAKTNNTNKYSIASGESLYAMARSDFYYVPIKSASITSVPELIVSELNAQDSDSNNKEYIVLTNTTDNAIDLSQYTIKKYFLTNGYDSTYVLDAYVLEAHKSVVVWKNGRKNQSPDLLNKYYNTNVDPEYIIEMSGGQFPVTTGYGLTIFKGDKEVSSIMYRYTDTYCTDGNVKFGIPAANTNVCPIVDNSTDNEAINFRGIDDRDAVEDAARLLTLGDDLMIMSDMELPTLTTHGCAVTWRSTNEALITGEGKLLAGNGETVVLTATVSRNGVSAEKSFRCTAVAGKTYKVTFAAMMDDAGNTIPAFEENVNIGYVLVDRNVATEKDMKLVVTATKNGETVSTVEKKVPAGVAAEDIKIAVNAEFTGVDAVTVEVVSGEATESNSFKAGTYLDGRKIDLFVIGDSITQFYKTPDFPREGWGAMLENYIDEKLVDVKNYGKSGRSLNTYFTERNFYDALEEVRPGDYVLIQLCTNDSMSSTAGIYEDVRYYQVLMGLMMAAIEEKGAYPILVESSYTHPHDNATKTFSEQPNIAKYNAAAEKVAVKYNAVITSIYDLTKNLIVEEGFEGMKDIMQYKTKNDLRYIEDDYLNYRGKVTSESLTDSYHYLAYGSDLQAQSFMTQLKATGLPISAGIDLSHEPVRLYYREMSFNGVAVSRSTYGATYTDSLIVTYDLGAAPSGTVKIDGVEIASGDTYDAEGSHVLELYIDENNTNTIPFTLVYSDAKKAEIAAALEAAKDDADAQIDAYKDAELSGIRAEMLTAAIENGKAAVAAAATKEEVAEVLEEALAEIEGIVTGSTLANNWVEFNGKVYCFDANAKEYAGRYKIVSGVGYNFADDGALVSGTWLTYTKGTRYYYAGKYYIGWNEIDGVTYYFDANGYLQKCNMYMDGTVYLFDETTGAYLGEDTSYTGFIKAKTGSYYYIDGVQQAGWVQVDGAYYYFNPADSNRMRTQDKIVAGAYYYINKDGSSDGIGRIVNPKGTRLYRAGVQIFDETVIYNGETYVVGANGWVVK